MTVITAIISDFIGKIIPLCTIAYGSRMLGSRAFGESQFSLYLLEFFGPVIVWGYFFIAVNELGRNQGDREKTKQYCSQILGLRLLHSSFSALCVLGIALFNPRYIEYQSLIVHLACMIMLAGFSLEFYFIGTQKLIAMHILLVIGKLSIFAAVVSFVHFPEDVLAFTTITYGINIFNAIVSYIYASKQLGLILPRLKGAAKVFKQSVPYGVFFVLMILTERIDVLIVEWIGGSEAVGVYSPALRLYMSIYTSIIAVGAVFYSESSAKDNAVGASNLIRQGFLTLFVISLPVSFGSWFLGEQFFVDLFGEQYRGSSELFSALTFGLLGQAIIYVTVFQILLPKRKIRVLLKVWLVGWPLAAGLLALMGSNFGVIGVAWGVSFTRLIQAGALLFMCRHELERLPINELKLVAIPCIAMMLVLKLLPGDMHWLYFLVVGAIVFLGVFLATNRHIFHQLVGAVVSRNPS